MGCARQRAGQLYRCYSLLTTQDLIILYKSWIRPILEYGNILYSGAATTHLCYLDNLQSQIEQTCFCVFQPLLHHRNAGISLLSFSWRGPCFVMLSNHAEISYCLHTWDLTEHLRFVNPCNFKTLAKFQ